MRVREKGRRAWSKGSPVGTWKLVSCIFEDVQTKERTFPYGKHPNGYAILTPEGRLMAILSAGGREVPRTAEDREAAFRSVVAYSGRYRLDGNQFVTTVDIAWNEAWVGTDQWRLFKRKGDRFAVEVSAGEHIAFTDLIFSREGENQRIIYCSIHLDFECTASECNGVAHGAMDLRNAAQ